MSYDLISFGKGTRAQKRLAQQQMAAEKEANKQNILLQLAARGAPLEGPDIPESLQGSQSAILPYYMGDIEKELGGDAAEIYRAIRARAGSPEVQLADYSALLGGYDSSAAAADALAEDLVSGRLAEKSLAEAEPVFEARRGVADARRNAGLEALKQTLNEIDSIQAGKGYSGDSTGKRMLRFNARRQIGTQSASDLAGADLENAIERRAIKETSRQQRLANLNLPESRIAAAITRKQAPERAVTSSYQGSQTPFTFFNLGPHQFNAPDAVVPKYTPGVGSNIGDEIGQIASNVGGSLANYYTKKNLAAQARQTRAYNSYIGGGGTQPLSDWSSDYDWNGQDMSHEEYIPPTSE